MVPNIQDYEEEEKEDEWEIVTDQMFGVTMHIPLIKTALKTPTEMFVTRFQINRQLLTEEPLGVSSVIEQSEAKINVWYPVSGL